MKKTKLLLLIAITCINATAQTNIQSVDISTPHTNSTSGGALITLLGSPYTNTIYTVTNSANVYYGDTLPTAFGRVNGNFVFVENQIATNFSLQSIAVTNTGTNYTLNGIFSGNGQSLSIHGTNLVSATVGSNAIAPASITFLQTTPEIISDTAGNGGKTIHIKAQDDGSDVYIHVTSLGIITATGSP
jgi:hypothetical protein